MVLSALMGIIVNSLSSRGIPLVFKKQEIAWGNDSLVNVITGNNDKLTDSVITGESQKTLADLKEKERANIEEKTAVTAPETDTRTSTVHKEAANEPVRIHVKTAFKLFSKDVLFVDARPVEEFTDGHIQGAFSIPYYANNVDDLLNKLDKDQPFVVYCSGDDCDLSIMLGNKMFKMGFKKVFVFFGGWNEWLDNKYPIETPE